MCCVAILRHLDQHQVLSAAFEQCKQSDFGQQSDPTEYKLVLTGNNDPKLKN
jgi:hypothetical protein